MFIDGLLTVALTLELLFLGMSVASSFGESGAGRRRTVLTVTGLSGAVIEAALLYLVTEELLTEAHEVKETPLITAAFFAGFVLLYLIEACT
ncbi:hypothetical protein [Deinococcus aquiradiocola]|uniref:Uncharacterized protein n=1 Tax=Deinococcus aquiradiocola TaxID=393059 RepID=A0A917PGK4_9DEIO|nr:hypothetical protein [Deinococcus aquiradiocola]GGJ77314.1 hypothetical protein GCM10008939_21770 [Deinococcus aquiradiocola]